MKIAKILYLLPTILSICHALVPFLDGGKSMPKMYDSYFNDQLSKQVATAISKAVSAGKKNIQVEFPPVPNVEEVKFGTPLNQKFGKVIAPDLKMDYKPGSKLSRNLVAYANVYWAKRFAGSVKGGALGGAPVGVLSAEPVDFTEIKSMGDLSRSGKILTEKARKEGRNGEAIICINPGGEETWPKLVSAHGQPNCPFVVMNNSYSTSYDLGNKKGFEEAYYLKRISKGFVFRAYPGPWEAYLEKPDGSVELLKSYQTKPLLREVSELVRETSFTRYALSNDRWMSGRM